MKRPVLCITFEPGLFIMPSSSTKNNQAPIISVYNAYM
jgi:hypothetical protein